MHEATKLQYTIMPKMGGSKEEHQQISKLAICRANEQEVNGKRAR
jgi:hypothetical protein